MTTVAESAHRIPRGFPAPWWRGRSGAALLVVVLMIVAFLLWLYFVGRLVVLRFRGTAPPVWRIIAPPA